MSESPKRTVRIACSECGGHPRNHAVVAEYKTKGYMEDYGIEFGAVYRVVSEQPCRPKG